MCDATTASAKGKCRTQNHRITNSIGKFDTIFYGSYHLGSCTGLTNLFHGVFKSLTVLCLKNRLRSGTDQLYPMLF